MYIEPFWAGVIATILCEFGIIFVHALITPYSASDSDFREHGVELTEDEMRALMDFMSELKGNKENVKNNKDTSKQ